MMRFTSDDTITLWRFSVVRSDPIRSRAASPQPSSTPVLWRLSPPRVRARKEGRTSASRPAALGKVWWRRGESNSCPRQPPGEHLQAQSRLEVRWGRRAVTGVPFPSRFDLSRKHTGYVFRGSPLSDVRSGDGDSHRETSLRYLGSESVVIVD